jgi:calcium-dependent protein kinase
MIGGVPQYKNPEVAKTKTLNGQLADTYALGIILYIMLTGGVPVWSGFETEQYQQINAEKNMLPVGENAYTQMKMELFSAEAQDLVSKMFQVDNKNRISANEIIKHPWLSLGGDFKSLQNQSTQSSSGY